MVYPIIALGALFAALPSLSTAQALDFSHRATEACLLRTFDAVGCIGVSAELCAAQSEDQNEEARAACFEGERRYWAARLETAYGTLLATAELSDRVRDDSATTPLQTPSVIAMQERWAAYRDAFCAVEQGGWGGAAPAASVPVQCQMTLTALQVLLIEAGMEIH